MPTPFYYLIIISHSHNGIADLESAMIYHSTPNWNTQSKI